MSHYASLKTASMAATPSRYFCPGIFNSSSGDRRQDLGPYGPLPFIWGGIGLWWLWWLSWIQPIQSLKKHMRAHEQCC